MSILKQLKEINIDLDSTTSLTPQEIIKIEKRLKAEIRLHGSLTINDVEKIINTLKNHTTELNLLYHIDFLYLRKVILNPDKLITFKAKNLNLKSYPETFILFIATNFREELEAYVNLCLKTNHYNALHCLLNYNSILGSELQDIIVDKLRKKLEFGVEYLGMYPSGSFTKVTYLSNPYLFRCLTQSGSYYYENNIVDLINWSANRTNIEKFYLCILFAIGEYKSSRTDLADIIKENKEIASQNGVREKYYTANEKDSEKTGATLTTNSRSRSHSSSGGSGKSGAGGIGIAVTIIIVIIKIALFSSRSTYNSSTPKFNWPTTNSTLYNINKPSDIYFPDLIDTINYYQMGEFTILEERDVAFDIDSTYFERQYLQSNFKKEGVIINQTGFNIITLLNTEKGNMIKFVGAHDTVRVHQNIDGISLYTGKNPTYIKCVTPEGEYKEGFKFGEWSYEHENLLTKYNSINFEPYRKMNIIISEDNFGIHVNSHHTYK